MQTNMSSLERPLRVIAGVLLLSLLFLLDGNARWWGLVGIVPLVTGLAGFCPLYTLIGRGKRT
ncbi:MAG TPA: DUF2892 domain-containing protein [Telluria sp.]|nr:DUF2892 domain-containing protein [Telluria sp.]